jgi:predicted enzyme related to lactoylglutathione lyase
MSNSKERAGSISWTDLTVQNAEEIRDFYEAVAGWKSTPVQMGDYNDYCMTTPGDGKVAAGICHARGANAGLPPQWLVYISVADIEKSLKACRGAGGKVLAGPREMADHGHVAIIQDPAGAVAALFQPFK